MSRHREHRGESADKRPSDGSSSPSNVIRRVRSPSRPRAWLSSNYKPKVGAYRNQFPRDERFHKRGFVYRKYNHFQPRGGFQWRDHFQPKHHEARDRERYERRDGDSTNQNDPSRPFLPRSTSSRDKDMQFIICRSDRNQSNERERSRSGEVPSTASQTLTREQAIQQKRRDIDEMYYQECEMFGLVAKMLIAKDPALEASIQPALRENLRDIGKRYVEVMEKFIEDYDSQEVPH